jgi:hypothetical protein
MKECTKNITDQRSLVMLLLNCMKIEQKFQLQTISPKAYLVFTKVFNLPKLILECTHTISHAYLLFFLDM